MSRAATMNAGLLLLMVMAAIACDSTSPGNGGSTGGLSLVTATAGVQPDHDGYAVMVDGTAHGRIGPNDSLTVAGIDAGIPRRGAVGHRVQLRYARAVHANGFSRVQRRIRGGVFGGLRRALPQPDRVRRGASSIEELFVMDADGSNVTSLKDSLGAVHQGGMLLPSVNWSADGSRAGLHPCGRRSLRDHAGTGRAYSSSPPPASCPSGPTTAGRSHSWSPIRLRNSAAGTFSLPKSDGSAVTRVTADITVFHYDFAANGSLLVYEDDPATTRNLIVVRPDGTDRRVIAPPPGVCCPQLPRLSPDGTKVDVLRLPEPSKTAMAQDTRSTSALPTAVAPRST